MSSPHAENLVYDAQLKEDIPFRSPTDAKIASLALTLDLPIQTIDLFLDILHDDKFKPDELTIRRGVEIFQHVSDFRMQRAITRANLPERNRAILNGEDKVMAQSSAHVFPMLILDLVIDTLLHEFTSALSYNERRTYKDTFRSMSLVHRSWTFPAQSSLAYSIQVDVAKDMQTVARAPIVKSWPKRLEVVFSSMDQRTCQYSPVSSDPKRIEGCRLTHGMFARFSRLRSLTITFGSFHEDDIAFGHEVLCNFGANAQNMTCLEELSLDIKPCFLASVACSTISSLPSLRKLDLRCSGDKLMTAGSIPDNAYPELFASISPGESLEHVSFTSRGYHYIEPVLPIIAWLLRPRSPEKAVRFFKFISEHTHAKSEFIQLMQVLNVIQPALPYLTALELHAAPANDDSANAALFESVLKKCTSLRRLAICTNPTRTPPRFGEVLKSSPSIVEEIYHKNGHAFVDCDFNVKHKVRGQQQCTTPC